MTLLAEAKVQGSHHWWPGLCPETDDRLKQNLAYYLPAPSEDRDAAPPGGIRIIIPEVGASCIRPPAQHTAHSTPRSGTPLQTETTLSARMLRRLLIGTFVVELLLAEASLRLVWGSSLWDLLLNDRNLGLALAAGTALAIAIAALSRLLFARFAPDLARDLMAPLFRGMPNRDLPLVSILPGLGEEALFRAVLQTAIGVVPAAIAFGLLHSGFSRRLLPYGLWATAVGAILGALYLWTGNLWGSILAHAVVNASGAIWLRRIGTREGQIDTGE